MTIIAIDPGIINLGFVEVRVHREYINVIQAERVNFTERCPGKTGIPLAEKVKDWFFEPRIQNAISKARTIIIEKQPPRSSALVIENILWLLLQDIKPDSVCSYAPNTVAAYFNTLGLPYEERKVKNVERALSECLPFTILGGGRQHDVCDAICLIIYHNEVKQSVPCIESFRYNPFKDFSYKNNLSL